MQTTKWRFLAALTVVLAIAAGACSADDTTGTVAGSETPLRELYDPTQAGEQLPENYRESLPRDAINPVYEPAFVEPSGVDWPGDDLVIGVDLDGEARAYPVGFLTFREMVIDMHRGIPTLVTW